MELSYAQKKSFFENGFVVIPSVVPGFAVQAALKEINYALERRGGREVNGDPELQKSRAITSLFNNTPVRSILETLVGEENMEPVTSVQVAMNFPEKEEKLEGYRGHLDGMLRAKEGRIENFTALAGVILSDQSTDGKGNFFVWPGSHLKHERYFREHGPEILLTDEQFRNEYSNMDVIDFGQPVQVKGKPGDLIIAHYQLLHSTAFNRSADIRYNLYFRVKHKDVKNDWKAPMTDLWLHFPAMQGFE